jgi:hypothetical protein
MNVVFLLVCGVLSTASFFIALAGVKKIREQRELRYKESLAAMIESPLVKSKAKAPADESALIVE